MLWVFFSLGAYTLWAFVNLGDKFVVGNRISNPYVYTILGFLAGTVGVIALPFTDFYVPSLRILFWIFLSALGFFFGSFFYVTSLVKEEVSRIVLLFNFLGIFTLVFAWFFIGDKLTAIEFIAFGIFLVGSILASLHFNVGKFKISKALLPMLMSCALYAGHDVITRYLTMNNQISFSLAFVYLNIFITLLSLTVFVSGKFRQSWKTSLQGILTWKLLLVIVAIMGFSRLGVLLQFKSMSIGPVALINAMEGLQSILVFVLAGLISWLAPKYIKEEWDRKNLLLKFAALVFMVVGIAVLNVK